MRKTMAYKTIDAERKKLQVVFLLPLLISLIILIIVPMASLFGLSFTNFKMVKPTFSFTGLENYIDLLKDDDFINAAKNSVFMVFFSVLFQMILGVSAAIVISKTKRFVGVVRALIIMPMVIPPVIIGLMWRILLLPTYGGIDVLLDTIGWVNSPEWLANPMTAKFVLVLVAVWEWTPFVIIFVLAALEGLPVSPYEAARIDGANLLQEIYYITLPLIKNVVKFVLVFRVVEGLKIFPLVFALTQGGPGRNTEELTYFIYSEGFIKFRTGYASAAAMLMFAVLIILVALFYAKRNTKSKEGEKV